MPDSNFFVKFIIFFFLIFLSLNFGQELTVPRVSPHATVSQTIGISEIKFDYHRPAVRERKIWGGLVPFNEVWRAGANENTLFEITHSAMIEGKELKAGKYGFHIIPSENEWTIIFNKVYTAWGSFFYDETKDALRIKIAVEKAPFQEWMVFGFENLSDNSATAFLHWENIKAPFKIEFDVNEIVVANFENELVSLPGFNWRAFYQAANFAIRNDVNLNKAEEWLESSIKINENAENLFLKAELLRKQNKLEEAEKIEEKTFELADEEEINRIGYNLLNRQEYEKAIEVFERNVKRNPESWNVYDSLAEAYSVSGDKKAAVEIYKKALEKAPEPQKQRIKNILSNLGK